jgi:hypothetical protein
MPAALLKMAKRALPYLACTTSCCFAKHLFFYCLMPVHGEHQALFTLREVFVGLSLRKPFSNMAAALRRKAMDAERPALHIAADATHVPIMFSMCARQRSSLGRSAIRARRSENVGPH